LREVVAVVSAKLPSQRAVLACRQLHSRDPLGIVGEGLVHEIGWLLGVRRLVQGVVISTRRRRSFCFPLGGPLAQLCAERDGRPARFACWFGSLGLSPSAAR
jgi:hypothetical protein